MAVIDKTEIGLDAFRKACRPPERLAPSDWAHDRVAIYEGKFPYYDKNATPWMNAPLDQLANPECSEIILLAPTGSGKTTMMEAAMAYIVAEDPGPTLIVGMTNSTIEEWFETRLMHTFKETPETRNLIPSGKNRHKARKDAIIFPHMTLFSTGANISGTQARSMRRVFGDEIHEWKKGIVRQAEARLHDRFNSQYILMSQGSIKKDDWHGKWELTNQHERFFKCPKCETEQTFAWCNVKYDEIPNDDIASAETARIACANSECDFEITENPELRRRLSMNAVYKKTRDGIKSSNGYRFTMLENWYIPLSKLVFERIQAMHEVSRGNLELLKSFIQKRLADFWDDDKEDNRVTLEGFGYKVSDYDQGQKIDDEKVRFMTVDRQADHFWIVIRAWKNNGGSRLLHFDKVDTWDRLAVIQNQYGVESRKVLVDCGHQKDEVYKRCSQFGWMALRGDQRDSYPHIQKVGKPIYKSFSRFQAVTASDGKKTSVAFFSTTVMKDILYQLRNQQGIEWEIPDDIGREYLRQIDSENRRGEGKAAVWKRRIDDNHGADCETMQVTLAAMLGIIGSPEKQAGD